MEGEREGREGGREGNRVGLNTLHTLHVLCTHTCLIESREKANTNIPEPRN